MYYILIYFRDSTTPTSSKSKKKFKSLWSSKKRKSRFTKEDLEEILNDPAFYDDELDESEIDDDDSNLVSIPNVSNDRYFYYNIVNSQNATRHYLTLPASK